MAEAPLPKFVRVSDDRTGHHYTTTRSAAEADSHLRVLSSSAVDPNGNPLPPKYKTAKGETPAQTTKENK